MYVETCKTLSQYKEIPVSVQRLLGLMLVTEVCVLFLIKLRWLMRKSTKLTVIYFLNCSKFTGKIAIEERFEKKIA